MKAIWSDDLDSSLSYEKEHVANMFCMAFKRENEKSREYVE